MILDEMIQMKKERGYSLKRISEESGIPVVTLQKIFSKKTENPRKSTLDAIAKVFYIHTPENIEKTEAPVKKEEKEYSTELVRQDITAYVHMCFYVYIKKRNLSCKVFGSHIPVWLDPEEKDVVVPDVMVICDRKKIRKNGILGAPDFILEVLSNTDRKNDVYVKLEKYLTAGVRECWMVDPRKKRLLVYDFMDENAFPCVYPLQGSVPVGIFDGDLQIDLNPISETILDLGNLN